MSRKRTAADIARRLYSSDEPDEKKQQDLVVPPIDLPPIVVESTDEKWVKAGRSVSELFPEMDRHSFNFYFFQHYIYSTGIKKATLAAIIGTCFGFGMSKYRLGNAEIAKKLLDPLLESLENELKKITELSLTKDLKDIYGRKWYKLLNFIREIIKNKNLVKINLKEDTFKILTDELNLIIKTKSPIPIPVVAVITQDITILSKLNNMMWGIPQGIVDNLAGNLQSRIYGYTESRTPDLTLGVVPSINATEADLLRNASSAIYNMSSDITKYNKDMSENLDNSSFFTYLYFISFFILLLIFLFSASRAAITAYIESKKRRSAFKSVKKAVKKSVKKSAKKSSKAKKSVKAKKPSK